MAINSTRCRAGLRIANTALGLFSSRLDDLVNKKTPLKGGVRQMRIFLEGGVILGSWPYSLSSTD